MATPVKTPSIPPKIAGVTIPPKAAPASSIQPKPEPAPVMKTGDELIDESEGISTRFVKHHIKLFHRHDASQFFKFFMRCSCGSEAREHSEEAIRKAADTHLQRSFVTENKWK